MNLQDIFQEHNFSEVEKAFMKESNTATTADMNQSRIVSEFIFGKRIERVTDKIITSNERLSDSNEKYSNRMLWLTIVLVFIGVAQVVVQAIQTINSSTSLWPH